MSKQDELWIIEKAPETVGALWHEEALREARRQLDAHKLDSLTIVCRGNGGPGRFEVVLRD